MDGHNGRTPREPWLALNLSAFLPGLGQIYSGAIGRGAVLAAAGAGAYVTSAWLIFSPTGNAGIGFMLLWPLIGLQIWNVFDAHKCASRPNPEDFEAERKRTKDAWLGVLLSRLWPGVGHFYLRRFGLGIGFMILTFVVFAVESIPYGWVLGVMFMGFACSRAYTAAPVRREKSKTAIVCVLLLIYLQSGFVASVPLTYEAFRIPTSSMEPALRVGDHILVRKDAGYKPERGDVIVLRRPDTGQTQVKRVAALGGESVSMERGKIYIDGSELRMKPFDNLPHEELKRFPGLGEFSWRIPKGCVFVLGDNITNSLDSRKYGPIPTQHIVGRVFKIYWPLGRAGPLR